MSRRLRCGLPVEKFDSSRFVMFDDEKSDNRKHDRDKENRSFKVAKLQKQSLLYSAFALQFKSS